MKFPILFLLVVISFTLYCCNTDELSLSRAERLLKRNILYPRDMPFLGCPTRVEVSDKVENKLDVAYYQQYFEVLENKGVLTFDTSRIANPDRIVFQAQFTDEGQHYVIEDTIQNNKFREYQDVHVKAGSFVFGKIRRLVQWKELKMAKVDFIEIAELSPFGKNMQLDKEYYRSAIFKKYENGWRLFSLSENEAEQKAREARELKSSREAEKIQSQAAKMDNDSFYVIVVTKGYDFDSLYTVASKVADLLHSKVDMLERIYKPHKGIIAPEHGGEELFRGARIPRWPDGDQNFVSIEMYMKYEEGIADWRKRDTLLMCVVANILKQKPAADSVVNLLKDKIKTVQALKRYIHYQCSI